MTQLSELKQLEAAARAAASAVERHAARGVELAARRDRAVVDLRAAGYSTPAIAKLTGLSITGVVKVLARAASTSPQSGVNKLPPKDGSDGVD